MSHGPNIDKFGAAEKKFKGPGASEGGGGAYEQRRVDLATFRAVKHSTWGHCPQVLCFTTVWDTPEKEKAAKWSSAPASILEDFT